MNSTFEDDDALRAMAREALGRGSDPSAAVFAAIHEAAVRHAAFRHERAVRVHRAWRRALTVFGGAAAAAVVLLSVVPRESLPPSTVPAVPAAVPEVAWDSEVSYEDACALMVLVGSGSVPTEDGGDEPLEATLLRHQERHGGFEDAHDLYASF